MPLGARVFLICLLAVLVTAAGGLVSLLFLGAEAAPTEDPSARLLEVGYSSFVALERERYEQLALVASVLADMPDVVGLTALPEGPIPTERRVAALEVLGRRRWNLGFAAVQDADGRTLLRTDSLDEESRPPVPPATRSGRDDGVWYANGRLFQTVTVPILPELAVPDAGIVGFLRVGRAVDDIWPQEIAKIGGSEVAFVVEAPGSPQVVSTTLDIRLVQPLLDQLSNGSAGPPLLEAVTHRGQIVARRELTLGGAPWVARLAPLRGSGDETAAAVVLLAPLAAKTEVGSSLQVAGLAAAAGVGLLLALPMAWVVGRGSRGPLRKIALLVEQARRGEATPSEVRAAGRGATEAVASALGHLLGDLEQRQTLQAAVRAAQAGSGSASTSTEFEPERLAVTLLGAELRRHAHAVEPRESLHQLQLDVEQLRRAAHSHDGGLEAVLGHRVLAVFRGEGSARRALGAAAQAMRSFTAGASSFEEVEPPAMVLASGRVVEGRLPEEGGRLQPVFLGLPAQMLETLLREAVPGEIYFSRDVHRELKDALLGAGVEPAAQNGILTPQPLYGLAPEIASKVAGEDLERPPTPAGPAPGAVLDERFEVRSTAGEGPVSTVYRAYDRELGREVALKTFHPGAVTNTDRLTALDSPLQSFRGLAHPHIARMFDYGTLDGRPFLSRAWVEGPTLGELLRRVSRLAPVAALGASRQLASALGAAHAHGLAHLRLKPGNILFADDGIVRVTDFGVAVVAPPLLDLETGEGGGWMAPEQEGGEAGDARSDVYTCGLLIHRLFVGIKADGQDPALPAPIAAIVGRCRATDPRQRFEDAREIELALGQVVLG